MVEMEGNSFVARFLSNFLLSWHPLFVCVNCPHVKNFRGGDTVDLEESARAIQVSDRMKGAMYFT